MNCYDDGNYWGSRMGGSLVELLTRYRSSVNPEVYYYSVNLAGGGQAQMDPKNDCTLLLSGWSEKIFSLMQQFEQPHALPTIRTIRDKYSATSTN